jgi:peptidyl-prolyl cis-trans isomerase B (cyclophilin B)
MPKLSLFSVIAAVCLTVASLTAHAEAKSDSPQETKEPQVTIEMKTNKGLIVLELNEGKAPATVKNFLTYAKEGFYDGTVFHRVINGFMIQGGGFTPDMVQKPTHDPIQNEAHNGLKNDIGTIAMARTPDPHSATAQFFINLVDNDFLNHTGQTPRGWGYCVFGKVVGGMDVVQEIAKVATGQSGPHGDVPKEPVVIEKVTVVEAKAAN